MKTFRLIPLLSLAAALVACADPVTGPVQMEETHALQETGTGFLGGGTRATP